MRVAMLSLLTLHTRPPRAEVAALAAVLALVPLAVAASEDVPPGRWQQVDGATLDAAWHGLEARFGPGWSVYTDTATGAPSMILGPAIPTGVEVRPDEAGIARARALLEELRDVLRVDDPSAFQLERAAAVQNPYGQDVVIINFKQTWRGLDVRHQSPGGEREKLAMVKFHFKGASLVMFGSDAVPDLRVPEEVQVDEAEATRRALGELGAVSLAAERVSARSYVSVRGDRPFLAREVEIVTGAHEPHDYKVIFDAHTGERVETRDDLRNADVVGNVKGGVLDYPGGGFSVRNLRALMVAVQGTSRRDYTDSFGNFTITNSGTTPVTITGRFYGSWADVQDQSGNGNLSFTQTATPGIPAQVVLNPTSTSQFETAEASAYYWTTSTRFSISGSYPGFNGLLGLDVNVNLQGACGSSWNGTSINFSRAGGSCNNTAYEDLVAHEYGHAFHDWFHGSVNPAGFSEGIADHVAYHVTDSRVIGRNLRTDGTPARDYRVGGSSNLTQWPCSSCTAQKRGEVWAGFTMDLKENLIASVGPSGTSLFRQLTIPLYASNPADEAEALTQVYLLDDNDADLSNGTPHCRDLTSAARRHSLPVPYLIPVSCGADPAPPSPEFRSPVPVAELNNTTFEASATLDDSQRQIWFTRPASGAGYDVWAATRPSIASTWQNPVRVTEVNSPSDEREVEVSGDGKTMFLATDRPGGAGGFDIWFSTRPTTSSPWSPPAPLTAANTPGDENYPSLTGDGLELFFRLDPVASSETRILSVSRSSPNSTNWTNLRLHLTAPPDWVYFSVAVSHDGLRLYCNALEVPFPLPPNPRREVWMFRRTAATFTFSARWRTETNPFLPSNLTADDFSLYFSYPFLGISRADRILPKMNGPRYASAGQSVTFSLRRDPGDFGYIALGVDPLPPTTIAGINGQLLILPLITVAGGVHDNMGVVTWTTPVLNAPGVSVYLQGISQNAAGQWYLSDRLSFLHLP